MPTLSKEAARAVIARRLRALDHPPDLLDGQAIASLIEHAGGSGVRLRAALAATLFLASTEDAPRIGRALVERALLESGDIPAAPPVAVSRPWRRLLVPGAALAGAGLVAIVLVLRPSAPRVLAPPAGTPAPAAASQAADTPPHALPPAQEARAAPPDTPKSSPPAAAPDPVPAAALAAPAPLATPAAAPAPAPAPATAPAPAPAPATTSPAPPAPAAEQAPAAAAPVGVTPDLPAAPAATVVLVVSPRDGAAVQRLDDLMQHLRAAGIGQIATQPSSAARARRPVSYFYADDLTLAQKITQILAAERWPRLAGNSLTPRLVIPPPGMPPRQPGLIEIQLP